MGANSSVSADYSAAAYAILTIDIVLTTAAVLGRTASQKMMNTTLAFDDYLCYLAYVRSLQTVIYALY
jgi:hypothetical protein